MALVLVVASLPSVIGVVLHREMTSTSTLSGSFTSLSVNNSNGQVSIRAARPGEQARVRTVSSWALVRPRTSVKLDGGQARIVGTCPDGIVETSCQVDQDIVVPAGTQVRVQVGIGDVVLTALSGTAVLETGVGSVDLSRSEALEVTASAGTGSVTADFVTPPDLVRVSSGVGSVDVRLPGGPATYAVTGEVGVGSRRVEVATDPTSTHSIVAEGGVGDVTVTH